ncbi:hypothetical protein D3C81_1708560 [compost metagenome]
MTTKYISLPLFSDAFYTYSVALEGNSYNLEFTYNERMQLYSFSLYDADLNPIVLGEALVPSYPIFFEYALFPLTGYFWMEEKANILSEPYKVYPDKINEYYNMYYIFDDGE